MAAWGCGCGYAAAEALRPQSGYTPCSSRELKGQRAGARHEVARNGSDQSTAIRWRSLSRTEPGNGFAGRHAPPAISCDKASGLWDHIRELTCSTLPLQISAPALSLAAICDRFPTDVCMMALRTATSIRTNVHSPCLLLPQRFFRGLLHAREFDICRTAHKGLNVPNSAHLCRTRLP
jgi:hypothetical protein